MDTNRFDTIVKNLHTRRAALGLAASLGAVLGIGSDDPAAAKCKKKCGPCKRCKKGKCKPKSGDPRCGPCSVCTGGRCQALCSSDDCEILDDSFRCLKTCDPPCGLCSRCDRVLGQCESLCVSDFCTTDGCRIPCNPPCGDCSVCDFGECSVLCESAQCVNNRCEPSCIPTCGSGLTCVGGECFPVCDPPCESGQGCVVGNQCGDLVGNCPAEVHVCFVDGSDSCFANSRGGSCVTTNAGAAFCAGGVSCVACEGDIDCESQGFGPNSRCIAECEFCFRNGGSGCVVFAGG